MERQRAGGVTCKVKIVPYAYCDKVDSPAKPPHSGG